jgi:tRNA (guanine26-N2/guanine27-N2)-dimethyltransferase
MKTIAAERSLFHLISLLDRMIAEALLPPYHYSLGELGKWNRADPPNRDRFLQALRDQGYLASVTHWNPEAFKTNAPWVTVKTTGKKI